MGIKVLMLKFYKNKNITYILLETILNRNIGKADGEIGSIIRIEEVLIKTSTNSPMLYGV